MDWNGKGNRVAMLHRPNDFRMCVPPPVQQQEEISEQTVVFNVVHGVLGKKVINIYWK